MRPWLLAVLVAASACSSGGGGPGGGGTVAGTLSVESNTLTFTALSTSLTPPRQAIKASVTGLTSGTLYVKVTFSGPAVSSIGNVVITGTTTGQADVYPGSAYALGPGVYTSTILVHACTTSPACTSGQLAGSPQQIDVTYTVYGVTASIASASYAIGNAPAPADLVRDFTVTGTPGQSWTATSDRSWLSLSAASGTGSSTPLTASLVPELVDAMPNGTYTGTITLVAENGYTTVRIPVTATIARTQLDYVSPAIATSGAAADVILRGQNLDLVTVQGLTFGGTAATSFEVVSGTEIHATHPALAAGSYPVNLQTDLGTARSLATTLTVVDAPSYASAALSYPTAGQRWFQDLAYDAKRRALFVGVQEGLTMKLLRYAYADGSGWSAPTVDPFPTLAALAWSPDGDQLLVGSDAGITKVDPSTLAHVETLSVNGSHAGALGVTNDGDVVVYTGNDPGVSGLFPFYRYSLRDRKWTFNYDLWFDHALLGTSGDGSLVVIGAVDNLRDYLYRYDTSARTFTSLGQRWCGESVVSVDRTGSRTLMGTNGGTLTGTYNVYDAGLALLGSLPATTRAAVLHPAGTRAYTYEPDGAAAARVRVFDLTQAPVAGLYPELGTAVALAANPDANAFGVEMLISPDGGTLFLAGDDAIVIQPAPGQ